MRFTRIKCRKRATVGAGREWGTGGEPKPDAVNLLVASERAEEGGSSLSLVRGILQSPGRRQWCAVWQGPAHDAVPIEMGVAPFHGAGARIKQNTAGGFRSIIESDQKASHWVRTNPRLKSPLCGQTFPELFNLGDGFPDLRLGQVLPELGGNFDQFFVHAHDPSSEDLGGREQKARGPGVAMFQCVVKGRRGDSPEMAVGAAYRGRCSRGVYQRTQLAEDCARSERGECAVVLRWCAEFDQHLAAQEEVKRISRVALSKQEFSGWQAHLLQLGRERGDLFGVESLKATESVNESGIDGIVHKSSRYTPRSMAALATRPSATM
jgi:hypothetical protein